MTPTLREQIERDVARITSERNITSKSASQLEYEVTDAIESAVALAQQETREQDAQLVEALKLDVMASDKDGLIAHSYDSALREAANAIRKGLAADPPRPQEEP